MKSFSFFLGVLILLACGEDTQETQQKRSGGTMSAQKRGTIHWQVPKEWRTETPSSGMRKAQFATPRVAEDPEDGSVVVFYFGGQGGSTQANLERWYSQFSQPGGGKTSDAAQVKKATVNGLQQTIVDVTGTYLFKPRPMAPSAIEKPGFRMLAAVVETDAGPWFVKFIGPDKTVAKWENSFFAFIGSFRY
jgi:hypothetical protein